MTRATDDGGAGAAPFAPARAQHFPVPLMMEYVKERPSPVPSPTGFGAQSRAKSWSGVMARAQ